jgi:hypothetical protein
MKVAVVAAVGGLVALSAPGVCASKGLRSGAASYSASSEALREVLDECGQNFGDGSQLNLQVGDGSGRCPDNGKCDNFYTLGNLMQSIDEYNAGRSLDKQFPNKVLGSRCLTLSAFLAQTAYESAQYSVCKEFVEPCPDPSVCSGGHPSHYVPGNQGADWEPHTIHLGWGTPEQVDTGRSGPQSGCTNYWGDNMTDPEWCWFGRGAIQITWLPNYNQFAQKYVEDPDLICEHGDAGWSGSVAYWNHNKLLFTGSCESATAVPDPANCPPSCVEARCASQHQIEQVLMPRTTPPTPPPPTSGQHVVTEEQAAGGCWTIANDVCPGQANSWKDIICNPWPLDGACPAISAGDVITFDCNLRCPSPLTKLHTVTAEQAEGGCWAVAEAACGSGNIWERVICHPSTAFGCPNMEPLQEIEVNCAGQCTTRSGHLWVSQELAVQGCWGVADVACNMGAAWQNVICSPSAADGTCRVQVDTWVEYNCGGCPTWPDHLNNDALREAVRHWCKGGAEQRNIIARYGTLGTWDTSRVTDMKDLFNGEIHRFGACGSPIGISNWNVANVVSMENMFKWQGVFQESLNIWDTRKVANMDRMFAHCSNFGQANECIPKMPFTSTVDTFYLSNGRFC